MTSIEKASSKPKLIAIAEDEATGEYLAIIEFTKIDGEVAHLIRPKSELRNVRQLIHALEDAGACLPIDDKKARRQIRSLLSSAKNALQWKYAPTTGWYDGHRSFIHPDRIIGKPRGDASIKPPRTNRQNHTSNLQIRGSHKKWVRRVAAPAEHSTRMVLAICAAFAAPLLDFVDLNSFGILIFGPGKAGKSTLLVAAGSVIGFASERDLVNFRTTDAAFGEIPAAFNDMMIPINELGLLKGNAADRNQRLGDLTYGLAEGRGTTYSKHARIEKSESPSKWSSIAFATGEEATDQIASAAGQTRMAGASIRWIDLPAVRKSGSDIFDLYENDGTASDRKKWVARECERLRKACRKHHGVAFEHFVGHLIRKRRTLGSAIPKLIRKFVKAEVQDRDDMAVRHLAMCFGIIAAAGILAVRFETLPYTEKFVLMCVKKCYRSARRALRTEKDLLRQALRVLQKRLRGKTIINLARVPQPSTHTLKACDGFRDDAQATIRAERFKDWFKDPRQPAIVLRWLYSKRALTSNAKPPTRPGTAILWAESQPKWPHGLRPRSIVIGLRPGLIQKLKAEIG